MKKTDVTITIEVETDVVKKAEALFHELGLDMNTATTIFLRQCIRNNGIPFKIGLSTEISDKLSSNQDHAIYPPLLVIAEQFGASLRLLV